MELSITIPQVTKKDMLEILKELKQIVEFLYKYESEGPIFINYTNPRFTDLNAENVKKYLKAYYRLNYLPRIELRSPVGGPITTIFVDGVHRIYLIPTTV